MNHREHVSTETLADHAEGLLGESEAGQVDAHLDDCADCRSTALLLGSLQEILQADDPGPMPAHYAARLDATLAELAIAEPVLPAAQAPARVAAAGRASGGAEVIDLASRRKVMVTGLRRVSTVAAGVVLLIGGAALGVQTLGHPDHPGPSDAIGQASAEPATYLSVFPTAPPGSTAGPHGTQVGPDGAIYSPEKVIRPDGSVVLAPKTKDGPPTVIQPKPTPQQPVTGSKAGKPPANTAVKPVVPPPGTTTPGTTNPGPAPVAPATTAVAPTAPPPAAVSPGPPSATPAANAGKARITQNGPRQTAVAPGANDPYVSESGTAYTEDNFAAKVMDLLRDAASDHGQSTGAAQPSTAGNFQSSSQDASDPAAPPTGPAATKPSTAPGGSGVPQSVGISSQGQSGADGTTPTRGPATPEAQALVRQCASQISAKAIAGDEGTWLDRKATIVVVPSETPEQVVGYVFYGDCTKKGPGVASEYQWKQRVNNPTAQPTPRPTPVRRVGDVTGSGNSQRNTVPAGGTGPSTTPTTPSAGPDPARK